MKISHKLLLFIVTVILFGSFSISLNAQDRIQFGDKDLWLNGGNIAWINFSRDVGPNSSTVDDFEPVFTQVNQNGGNALRFWVHINGSNTPAWSGGQVTGPGAGTIDDLRAILDAAWEKDIGLVLCLWSFDMLRESSGNALTTRNRNMLEDSTLTQAYIDNALIPMVEELGDHPAIIAWEIFNEAEGMSKEFGWDNITGSVEDRVAMSDIQRFTNMTAGAIHRTNADAVVSNGAWSFHALAETSNSTSKNYYSDEELISAGKDSLGTLDFYMVHYYEWGGTALSPFHNHADSWGLDKPIVVGEFGIPSGDLFGIPGAELYESLYENGYAGALVWQWVDWYQNRGDYGDSWLRGLDQMLNMKLNYPGDISLGSTYPQITRFSAFPNEIAVGDSTRLNWQVHFADNVTLDGNPVAHADTIFVSPTETTTYEIAASSATTNVTDTASITVKIVEANQINRALLKPAFSSANETGHGNADPNFVTDGDSTTRWSSPYQDNHWIYIDLEAAHNIESVLLDWEAAYGKSYDIQTSLDSQVWTTVFEERNGNGEVDSVAFDIPVTGRYVRMLGKERATQFGFSLWRFEVRGLKAEQQPPEITLSLPGKSIQVREMSRLQFSAETSDVDGTIEKVAFYLNDEEIANLSEAPFTTETVIGKEGEYHVHATVLDSNGYKVQSTVQTITVLSDLYTKRFEAESGILSDSVSVIDLSVGVSGDGYVIMKPEGQIFWKNVGMGSENEFNMKIRYRLSEGINTQQLIINDTISDTLTFDGASNNWQIFEKTLTTEEEVLSIGLTNLGENIQFDYLELNAAEVSTTVDDFAAIPNRLALDQNYPNPFNPTTTISYELPNTGFVSLKVYSLIGQEVATLINSEMSAGKHQVTFDASALSSGVYLIRLQSDNGVRTRKISLIK
ncbi:hypothetical protein BH23BAC3_BH23BAC3_04260 [soil metagenome]